jgi:hypothetical protein
MKQRGVTMNKDDGFEEIGENQTEMVIGVNIVAKILSLNVNFSPSKSGSSS